MYTLEGKSVARCTGTAMKWDKEWSKFKDPSGRAVTKIHVEAYDEKSEKA